MNPVASVESKIEIAKETRQTTQQKLTLVKPELWSPATPNLYTLRTDLRVGTRLADIYQTPLGIREIRFDAQQGIFVNGVNTKMKGMCNHQDLGPLGSALWDQALERRMKMLKDMGCNAIFFLNGTSLGTRTFDGKNDMHLEWLVPYQPGELKVVARKDGKVAATMSHHTAGAPAKISISADQSALDPAKRDLSYVTIRVEDENGNFAPKAAKWVQIQIEGPGRLVGSGGGDPLSHTPF